MVKEQEKVEGKSGMASFHAAGLDSVPLAIHSDTKYISNRAFIVMRTLHSSIHCLPAVQWMHAKETKVTNRILPGGTAGHLHH